MKVIANSLPKSGTHLLTRLLDLLHYKEYSPGLTGAIIRPTQKNPFSQFNTHRKRCSKEAENCFQIDLDDLDNRIKKKYLDKYLDVIPDNSFISAHLPYSEGLDNYLKEKGFGIIYIIRDPRDVLLSYYNHQRRDSSYPFHDFFKTMSLDDSCQHILEGMEKGNIKLAPLYQRIKNSKGWIMSPNSIAVKFEELIGRDGGGDYHNQLKVIGEIISYLGEDKTKLELEYLAKNIFYRKAETFYKGQIYRWKSEFSAMVIREIDEYIGDIIRELGYDNKD